MLKGSLAVLLGGLVLFAWGYVSWVVIGFLDPALHGSAHEAQIIDALGTNLEESGAYFLPRHPNTADMDDAARDAVENDWKAKLKQGPVAFLFFRKQGTDPDDLTIYVQGLVLSIVSCLLVVVLLAMVKRALPGVFSRIVFVMLVGATTTLPHWINLVWFHYPLDFTILLSLDTLIGWFLASLVIAQLVRPVPGHRLTNG
ncbi:MAG: hypothetical protein ACYST0_03445 [Planctomycetota bacterium]